MIPPFALDRDYLQVLTGTFYHGNNENNLREVFYSRDMATITGTFNVDAGDLTLPDNKKEPRAFGTVFTVTQVVTGTRISVRVQANSGWGTASVLIDGVAPTTISGVQNAIDTVSSDTDFYQLYDGTHYLDVLLAENLANTTHTVKLTVTLPSSGLAVFVYCGMKARTFRVLPHNIIASKVAQTLPCNQFTLGFVNESASTIDNVNITTPSGMYKLDGSAFAGNTLAVGAISTGMRYDFGYSLDGILPESSKTFPLVLTCDYEDAAGDVIKTVTTDYAANSPSLTYSLNGWFFDSLTPNGSVRAISSKANVTATFLCNSPNFIITLYKEYGFGTAQIYVDGVLKTTLSSADPVGGGFLADQTVVTDIVPGSGYKTVMIEVTTAAAKPFVFTNIQLTSEKKFTRLTETINIDATLKDVLPFDVSNVSLSNGEVVYDTPDTGLSDWSVPKSNLGLLETRTYARFPTYCVYYGYGMEDTLNKYDLLVIEPSAASYKKVKRWKDAGIKVFGYVSFGEEDGDRVNPFDLSSAIEGPHIDDGLGVGGYASYYNKGGNRFAEQSECSYDKQRFDNVKACELSNPKYLTAPGRCSPVCEWDSRAGAKNQSLGLPCAKGYTISNFYIRDASVGCMNGSCPQYAPLNKGCTQYMKASNAWGLDLSVADTNFPDQNGIWDSSFINPIAPRWKEKLKTFYLRTVFGLPQEYTETLTFSSASEVNGTVPTLVARVTHYPIDTDEPFILKSVDGLTTLTKYLQFNFDDKGGVISISANALKADGVTPLLVAGDSLVLTYSRKGLDCDGVFMDTVDTVDVYPSPEFQSAFAGVINGLKSDFPNKSFCSNRGFTIFADVVKSCSHIMFESFLVDYNWTTGVYSKIAHPDSITYNRDVIYNLRELRKTNVFDVLALNYCDNGPSGNELRQYVYDECYKEGFMCWTSTILLNAPEELTTQNSSVSKRISTNNWRIKQRKKL